MKRSISSSGSQLESENLQLITLYRVPVRSSSLSSPETPSSSSSSSSSFKAEAGIAL